MDTHDLKRVGLSATLPRVRILELFERTDKRHLNAEDIYKALLESDENVGLATVYRVLNQFCDAGILNRLSLEKNKLGQTLYELNRGDHHDHLYCLRCGKIEEFFDPQLEKRQESVAKHAGWSIHEHSMVLSGLCPQCKALEI